MVVTADAAKRLGVSTRQVARMVAAGKLSPAFKAPGIRGAYLFDRTAVEELAKDGDK